MESVGGIVVFLFKQKTAYEIRLSLVGSEMCIGGGINSEGVYDPENSVAECACAPMGVMGLLKSSDVLVKSWVSANEALAAAAVEDEREESRKDPEIFEVEVEADVNQEPPWEHWERIAQDHADSLKPSSVAAVAAPTAEGIVAPQLRDDDNDLVPAMPTVNTLLTNDYNADFVKVIDNHRVKVAPRRFPFNALVARPVGKKEIKSNPRDKAAMDKEWNRLKEKNVWNIEVVRDMSDVAAEAKTNKKEIQFGWLFGICVEKNSELPEKNPARKFKGRVVFQGNRVVNQNWDMAVFQYMGNSPATIDASRAADCYGCMLYHNVPIAYAEQVYIQA